MTKYFVYLFALIFLLPALNCRKNPVEPPPPPDGSDAASNNFTWTTYAFGDGSWSCILNDAAIINDTLIYVVGPLHIA